MEAKELRIGNSILINNEVIHNIGYGVITDVSQKNKGLRNQYLDLLTHKPIQLTEKWLLEFGFEKIEQGNDYKYAIGRFYLFKEKGKDEPFYLPFLYTNIEYVHQLQNLFFALTGKEISV